MADMMARAARKFFDYQEKTGYSNKKIAEICGISANSVTEVRSGRQKIQWHWLEKLAKHERLPATYFINDAEAGRKSGDTDEYVQAIPILGRIAASFHKSSEELEEGKIMVPTYMVPKKRKCFALFVSGNSMIDAGIHDGDLCIIESTNNTGGLKNGQIAAFRIDGDETLKYYEKIGAQVWLKPANKRYEPKLISEGSNVELIGLFHSLLRLPS